MRSDCWIKTVRLKADPTSGLAHARATPKASQRLELETGHYDETERSEGVAGWTGLEPAASGVTGRRSNQLNYHPNG